MTEKEPIRPPRHIEEVPYICLPEFAIEQKERISQLEHHIELMEAQRGALNPSSIRTILAIVSVAMTIGTAVATMWLNNSTEPTRTKLDLLAASVDNVDEGQAKDSANIDELRSTVNTILRETLRTEDVEQRLSALTIQIEGQDGKFNRIIDRRIEPRISRDEERLAVIEHKINEHLQKP